MAPLEPVAVVGLGCRFAGGAGTPEEFWDLLAEARSVTGSLPEERWQGYQNGDPEYAAAVRRATRHGAFLADIEGFDAEFFGLTPREAELMDPQQRILLEVAWEALEHAGIPPGRLAGTDAGVFVGIGSDDYGRRLLEDLPRIEAWTGIGAAMCAAANRISYALDLRGPSLAVDTACSSSLVAVQLACQSLRLGECTVALAGGVNLVVAPGLTITLDAAGALAPDGRCKPFDAAADGYGRGEGCGVVVLKRLSDARRTGDRVLALIRGGAVNQDGRTSGIMAPSQAAQEHVLRQACSRAGVAPESIGYVEAHGTGTRLGDPVEAAALGNVYGGGRAEGSPCLIGSVKSNIGHLEAAAGIAGLIKTVLALEHETIPPSLHYSSGNPAVEWDGSGLAVVRDQTAWLRGDEPRRAGVSGFGYGGTIAHLVVEEAPEPVAAWVGAETARPRLYPLSAGSEGGLRQQAERLADWLSGPGRDTPLASVGHTLASRRSHLTYRMALVATDREELVTRLRRFAGGGRPAQVTVGQAPAERAMGLVWVFSGHGSHWAGMGRDLLTDEPVFADVMADLEPIFLRELGLAPRVVLADGDLGTVDRIQPMIFAMQLGLAEVWRSFGVEPDAVIGHSVGEIAAAVVVGALSRHDGARLVCRRSRLLRSVAGRGAMAMVQLPFEEVRNRLAGRSDVVAAISASPHATVVSGDTAAIDALAETLREQGVPLRRVASDVAFHSPHMDPLLADLEAAARDLDAGAPRLRMYSTALDDPRAIGERDGGLDGSYWVENLRNPVRLAAAVEAAAADGYRCFLEISPHPVVAHSIDETLEHGGYAGTFVGSSLRRNRPERLTLLHGAGAMHCHGLRVDWSRLQPSGELVSLPRMAWQHRRHWRDVRPALRLETRHDVDSHSLLGDRIPVAGQTWRVWRTVLDESSRPYPGRHAIEGVEIVPAAVLVNTVLRAVADGSNPPILADIALRRPLVVAEPRDVQVVYEKDKVRICSRASDDVDDGPWLTHVTAVVCTERPRVPGSLNRSGRGVRLDPAGVPSGGFDWQVEELWRGANGPRATVRLRQPRNAEPTWAPVLDAAFSVGLAARPNEPVRVVADVENVQVTGAPPDCVGIEVVEASGGEADDRVIDVLVGNSAGEVVAYLRGVRYAPLARARAPESVRPVELVHQLVWRPFQPDETRENGDPRRHIVLVTTDATAWDPLRHSLVAAGATVRVVADPELPRGVADPCDVLVLPPVPPSEESVPDAAAHLTWLLARTAQSIARLGSVRFPRLWCVTVGAAESRRAHEVAQATLWGLGRVIAGEHPELWGGTVDLDPDDPAASADLLLDVVRHRPNEDVIRIRADAASVARLARAEFAASDRRPGLALRPNGTYLVTGGLGALGPPVARWLADRGARRIVLTGRRPLPARSAWDDAVDNETRRRIEAIRALEERGVTIRVAAFDIADAEQAAAELTTDALGMPTIRGVVHLAGDLDDRLLLHTDPGSLRKVLRPKVHGAWVLHNLFPPGSLDFLVLFSSCGQLLGLPGQAGYGSANAFLDALAAHRNQTGPGDTWSLGWTSWRDMGMAVNEAVDTELRARGVSGISAEEAFVAWDLAARHGPGYFAVLRAHDLESATVRLPILRELRGAADAVSADSGPVAGEGSFVVDELAELPPQTVRDRVLQEVVAQIADEMRLPPARFDPGRSLTEQGLDSVMTVIVRRRLENRFGQALPATLLWQQPTASAIADHLVELLTTAESSQRGNGQCEPTST